MDFQKGMQIEAEYKLTNMEMDGFPYWNLFRFDVFNIIRNSLELDESTMHQKRFSVRKALRQGLLLINPLYYNLKDSDYLFMSGGRRVKRGVKFYSPSVDPILDVYSEAQLIELPDMGIHYTPQYTKRVFYADRIEFISEVLGFINRVFNPSRFCLIQRTIEESLKQALSELSDIYQVKADWSDVLSRMARFYYGYQFLRKAYNGILDRISPKVLIVQCSYGKHQMIMIDLCRSRNIPTIELQHGAIGKNNYAYNYLVSGTVRCFPDYIFLFSEYWRNRAIFPIKKDHLIAVGYPYGEMRVNELSRSNNLRRKTILFLSQYNLGPYLSKIAIQLNESLNSDVFRIVYKMHPSEYSECRNKYTELFDSGVEIANDSSCDLYELFSESDFIVGVGGSTALYEGMMFEAHILIYLYLVTPEFLELCEAGLAYGFADFHELSDYIINNADRKSPKGNFWENDALTKTKLAVDTIMKRGY